MPRLDEFKLSADDILELEEQDWLIKTMAAYLDPNLPNDIMYALKDRLVYFFGIEI